MITLIYCIVSFVIGFFVGSFLSDKVTSYMRVYANAEKSELI
jgi:uncharacterized protein YneF (UPF0154 family)